MADALSRYLKHKKKWKMSIPLYLKSPKLRRRNPLDVYTNQAPSLPKTYSHIELTSNFSPSNLQGRVSVLLPALDGSRLVRGRQPTRAKSVNRRINRIFVQADSELKRNPSEPIIKKSRSQSTKTFDAINKISEEKTMYNTQEIKRIIQSRENQKSKYTERLAARQTKRMLLARVNLSKKLAID